MAATPPLERLRDVAAPAVAEAGLVLEELTLTPMGRRRLLRVTVDLGPDQLGGVPVDTVAEASRLISEALDRSELMGEAPYLLEVSSPGVDRPLTERRHWARARGRLIRATLAGGGECTGRLTAVEDAGITLGGRDIGWDELRTGRVEIEFGHVEDEPEDQPEELDGAEGSV